MVEQDEEDLLMLQEEEELLMLESADLMFEEDILDEEEKEQLLMLESDFSLGEDEDTTTSSYDEQDISFLEADTYERILEVDLQNSMIDAEAHDEFDYHADEDSTSTRSSNGHKYNKNDFDEAEGDEHDAREEETGQRRMNTDTSQSISAPETSISHYSPDYSNTF